MIDKIPSEPLGAIAKFPATTFLDRTHYSGPYDHGYHHQEFSYDDHGSYKKQKSRSVALTALTLLTFLFFLHILQQCLQEHMDQMDPQVIIMQARRRLREAQAKKSVDSTDTIYVNTTSSKRQKTTQSPITDEYYYEYSQIPIKLKTRHP